MGETGSHSALTLSANGPIGTCRKPSALAALVVRRVLDGSTLPVALAAIAPPERDAAGRRRALVQELAYGTLRHWGTLDALVREARGEAVFRSGALAASSRSRSISSTTRARRRSPSSIMR